MGAVLGGYGAFTSGQAQAGAARFNSQVANQNAKIAHTNADIASEAGAAQVAIQGEKNKAQTGEIKANQGASGIDIHSGSALDTQLSAHAIGMADAMNIRSQATREAWGEQNKEVSDKAESTLDLSEAHNANNASYVNAGSTFLSQASSSAAEFGKYAMAGGLD